MSDHRFDERSHDAMFSKILAGQDELTRKIDAHRIETANCFQQGQDRMTKHDRDIGDLKEFRAGLRGKIAGFVLLFSGLGTALWSWLVSLLTHSQNPPSGH